MLESKSHFTLEKKKNNIHKDNFLIAGRAKNSTFELSRLGGELERKYTAHLKEGNAYSLHACRRIPYKNLRLNVDCHAKWTLKRPHKEGNNSSA